MSTESELLRKQNVDKLLHRFACKKSTKSTIIVRASNTVIKTENFFAFLSLWQDKRFHFPTTYLPFHLMLQSVYFVWWTLVLWGHHATFVLIEKTGALEQLCLRTLKSLIWHWYKYKSVFKIYCRLKFVWYETTSAIEMYV